MPEKTRDSAPHDLTRVLGRAGSDGRRGVQPAGVCPGRVGHVSVHAKETYGPSRDELPRDASIDVALPNSVALPIQTGSISRKIGETPLPEAGRPMMR